MANAASRKDAPLLPSLMALFLLMAIGFVGSDDRANGFSLIDLGATLSSACFLILFAVYWFERAVKSALERADRRWLRNAENEKEAIK